MNSIEREAMIVEFVEKMVSARLPENHAAASSYLVGRLLSFEDGQDFLIYLATRALSNPYDYDVVLSSWGLLKELHSILGIMDRRKKLIHLLGLNCCASNLAHREKKLYRTLANACLMFHEYPDSVDGYLVKVKAFAKSRNHELPAYKQIVNSGSEREAPTIADNTTLSASAVISRGMLDEIYERLPFSILRDLKMKRIDQDKATTARNLDGIVVDILGKQSEMTLRIEYRHIVEAIFQDMNWYYRYLPRSRWDDQQLNLDHFHYINDYYDILIRDDDQSSIREYFIRRQKIVERILEIDDPKYDRAIIACEQEFYQAFSNALGRILVLRYQISPLSHRQMEGEYTYTHVIPVSTESTSRVDITKLSEIIIYLDNEENLTHELSTLLENKQSWYIAALPEGFILTDVEYPNS